MPLALGVMVVLLGAVRLAAAALLHDVQLRRQAWLWISTGIATAVAQA